MTASPSQTPASGANWYPKLDGLDLPQALVAAIRKAFDTIYAVRALASSPQPLTWLPLALLNGWTKGVSSWPPSAAIDNSGMLALSGVLTVTSFATNTKIASLPAGLRPSQNVQEAVTVFDTTSTLVLAGYLQIATDGSLTIFSTAITAGHHASVFLDGISARLV